jgi:hypothetical protein
MKMFIYSRERNKGASSSFGAMLKLRRSEVELEISNSTAAQRRLSPRQNCCWRSISVTV